MTVNGDHASLSNGSGPKQKVLIVGAGIYGISTALHMLEDGRYDITVLEKSGILPAPDAASTDLNKIIRAGDYADPSLSKLAIDSVQEWKKPEWEGTYHESGVFCLSPADSASGREFVRKAYENCINNNLPCQQLNEASEIQAALRARCTVPIGEFDNRIGYANPTGGWAEAARALEVGIKRVRQGGATVRPGAEVAGLERDGRKVKGVKLRGGEVVEGDLIVFTAGAWTPALCASEGVSLPLPDVVATGQTVATIQLTPEEAERYSKIPVIFNKGSGYYMFPPNPDALIKCAIHGAGFTNPPSGTDGSGPKNTSVPRTKLTPGAEDGMIPLEALKELRAGLADHYPEFKDREFVSTRLCWYADTPTGDWLVDYHPDLDNLLIATGDSGHALKFFPLIGREIMKILQRQGDPEYTKRWAFNGAPCADADERVGVRQVLGQVDMAIAQDLQA